MRRKNNNVSIEDNKQSIFDNYKCDGQLVMKWGKNGVEIVDEQEEKVKSNLKFI